ncbi:MAG: hypothetical protein Q4F30_10075 [Akkermansia sp.]|nr:hypothetical protein [Akkermansia sp.]
MIANIAIALSFAQAYPPNDRNNDFFRGAVIGEYILSGNRLARPEIYDHSGKSVAEFFILSLDGIKSESDIYRPSYTSGMADWVEKDEDGISYRFFSMRGGKKQQRYLYSAEYRNLVLIFSKYGQQRTPAPNNRRHIAPVNKDGYPVIHEQAARMLAKALLKHCTGEENLPRDAKRERQIFEKILKDKETRELQQKQQAAASSNADSLWTYCYMEIGDKVVDLLGLKPGLGTPAYPNVNEGKQDWANARYKLERGLADATKSKASAIPVRTKPQLSSYEISCGKSMVYAYIAHAYNRDQATRLACHFPSFGDAACHQRFMPRTGHESHWMKPEEVVACTESAGDAVGEFAIRMRHVISDEGLPVKGSEKRSIYFTRGNTAVAVFTEDPAINVLPAAREIDKMLAEGLREHGVPLTKEQDYLKEEKKQK